MNPGDAEAEKNFKEVNEAYAVLSDADKKAKYDQYGFAGVDPQAGFGEDIAFCMRAKELGAELWCDSTIKCGHVGMAVYTEDTFSASRVQIGRAGGA